MIAPNDSSVVPDATATVLAMSVSTIPGLRQSTHITETFRIFDILYRKRDHVLYLLVNLLGDIVETSFAETVTVVGVWKRFFDLPEKSGDWNEFGILRSVQKRCESLEEDQWADSVDFNLGSKGCRSDTGDRLNT